jgi:hypothetical protein
MALQLATLLETDGFEAAKMLVSQSIVTSDDIRTRYGWATPIFEKTTDQFIAEALATEAPKRIYKINPLAENLGMTGQLLDLAISRQDMIYGLEMSALNSVIDDLVFSETVESEEKIAKSGLKATLAQYAEGPEDATSDDVAKRYSNQRSVNAFRASSRSVKGGALNLAERITFLREQQAETIRTIHERLMSVVLVLPSSGLGRPERLPTWNSEGGLDNLRALAKWIKAAIKSVERNIANENIVDVAFSTSMSALRLYSISDAAITSAELTASLADANYDDFKFDFDRTLIAALVNVTGDRRFRLLSVGVAFLFDDDLQALTIAMAAGGDISKENTKREILRDWRARMRMSVQVLPPRQRGTMADGNGSEEWGYSKILMHDVIQAATIAEIGGMTLVNPEKMLNLNPIGRWTISIAGWAKTVNNLTGTLNQRPFGDVTKLFNPIGLIFSFRLAYI